MVAPLRLEPHRVAKLGRQSMRPGTRGNKKCLDRHRTGIRDYGVGAVRIEFEVEHTPCKDLPPVA